MKSRITFWFFAILFVTVSFAHAGEWVTFKGSSQTANPITLKGMLEKPQGKGPFPAIVMLHGCAGIKKNLETWAKRLASWGYVALMVDSLGPRGESDICSDPFVVPPTVRAQDAYDAKTYLAASPFVKKNQIALMGWSHGGWTVLHTINGITPFKNKENPFQSAIAFYPYCSESLLELDAPLLILIGKLDDWCPASRCEFLMPSAKTAHEVKLKIYPQATHCFDWEGIDMSKDGHRLLYNPEAAKDAGEQVRNFLKKYFG